MIWLGWVLWHINHCRLFNAKSSLYIYIKYNMIWLGWVLWHINHCRLFNAKSSLYIYIYIYDLVWLGFHHHHHVTLVAQISLTLSRHSSLSFIAPGRSSGQHPISLHSCWMYVRAGRPAFAQPCVEVHKSTSLMSSSLLLQQCPQPLSVI